MFSIILFLNLNLNVVDSFYEYRHLRSNYLSQAKEMLEKEYALDRDNPDVLWRLARVYFKYGDISREKRRRLYWYSKGRDVAGEMKKKFPHNAEAHFWYAVNTGRMAELKGILNSLSLASVVKKSLEKTLKFNPNHTGALEGLGVYYYRLPGYAGGSTDKALFYMKKAMAVDPNYTVVYIDMAKVYIKKKEYHKARYYLKKVINMKNPTHPADYYLEDKPEAKRLLKKLQEVER